MISPSNASHLVAHIPTGYDCNNRCIFCINSEKSGSRRTTKEIHKDILLAKAKKKRYLCFLGGENTIRSDIVKLIAMADRVGFDQIYMSTNGRMFSYKEFAKEIIDSGITGLNFSIHGHTEELHDFLTRTKGSFKETISGIENIRNFGFKNFSTTTVIVKPNYKNLPDICRLSMRLGAKNAGFSLFNPYGDPGNFKRLMPRISKAAPFIKKCLDIGRTKKSFSCSINYLPLCYFSGYEKYVTASENEEIDNLRTKPINCSKCEKDRACSGIWRSYIEYYGAIELQCSLNDSKNGDY